MEKIFIQVKELAKKERQLSFQIIDKLIIIEKDKLYCDLKYPSLHKYLTRELKYSDSEAALKVGAVSLSLKSTKAKEKIKSGELSLSNAYQANKILKHKQRPELIEKVLKSACNESTRSFKETMAKEFNLKRSESLVLDEETLKKFDRLRKKYGDLSNYELIQVLLEKELKAPTVSTRRRGQSVAKNKSRYIPKAIKKAVYTGKCRNCESLYGLEYHHKHKFSHGGDHSRENLEMLCGNCNQREEMKTSTLGFFS